MDINWFPGHMKKTEELIKNNIKLIDIVIELLDARIPISSKNPKLNKLIKNKPKIVVLNKSDLADPKILNEWIAYYKDRDIIALPVNSLTGQGIKEIYKAIDTLYGEKKQRYINKGLQPRDVRIMIAGIPNVGKSSIINKMVGKKSARIGNRPGITRGKQWIKIKKGVELFDTPGILWPKLNSETVGKKLSFTGAVDDKSVNIDDMGFYLLGYILNNYPSYIKNRYKIDNLSEDTLETMETIAKKRGCILSGNRIDYTRVAKLILVEFRQGLIGKISLEKPQDLEDDSSEHK